MIRSSTTGVWRKSRGVTLLLALLSALATAQRAIQLDIQADWPAHASDDISEVAEFVADYSPGLYWKYIDSYCNASAEESPVAVAERLLPSNARYLLETSVGLGTYAPAVRFFDSLSAGFADQCDAKAVLVTYPGEVSHCLSDAALTFHDEGLMDVSGDSAASWDHVYPAADSASARHVVLYGSIGSSSFCALHRRAVSGADVGQYRYSVRHASFGETVAPTRTLQGYGVYLDIKNMEYKNLDDSQSGQGQDGAAGGQSAGLPDEEVKVNISCSLVVVPNLIFLCYT